MVSGLAFESFALDTKFACMKARRLWMLNIKFLELVCDLRPWAASSSIGDLFRLRLGVGVMRPIVQDWLFSPSLWCLWTGRISRRWTPIRRIAIW
jgi:hypothetical protein